MNETISKKEARQKRHIRLRKKVLGTAERPRLVVFKSLKNIYIQCVDDTTGTTVCSASTLEKGFPGESLKSRKNKDAMVSLAQYLIGKLNEKGIDKVGFDRNGYRYHGKLKMLTEKLREAKIKV